METSSTHVASLAELMSALSKGNPRALELQTAVACPYSITLPPGFSLTGTNKDRCILSFGNGDGIGLTVDNSVSGITVIAAPGARAIYTQTGIADMGTIALGNLAVTGQVSIITRTGTDKLKIVVDGLHIASCDSRRYSEQPQKYGVNVYQGALTVYNFNGDPNSRIKASLTNIAIGARNAPVLGSGIFVSGFGDHGGWVDLDTLTTGEVHSTGMLPYGTADIITAGVFVVYGVDAKRIEHFGEVVTYGVNDMVLDTWGTVEQWIAHAPVVSYGPSGIGFVNFGTVNDFVAGRQHATAGGSLQREARRHRRETGRWRRPDHPRRQGRDLRGRGRQGARDRHQGRSARPRAGIRRGACSRQRFDAIDQHARTRQGWQSVARD